MPFKKGKEKTGGKKKGTKNKATVLLQERREDAYDLVDSVLNFVKSELATNDRERKLKAIDKQQTKARLAEMAYVDAIHLKTQDKNKEAISIIEKYYELDTDYLDLYAELLVENKQLRKAKNVVLREWKKNPYYQTASIWLDLGPKDVTKKVTHMKLLLKDWENSHIAFELIAKTCIDAEIWGEAKDYLNKAIDTEERVSHFLLMAKVERLGFKNKSEVTTGFCELC